MKTAEPPSPGPSHLVVDRRQLLAGAGALGLSFGPLNGLARAEDAPKKGGTLRMGMEGGSASDSLDFRTYTDSIHISYGYQIFNGLTEIAQDGSATGELLESWSTKPGATEWVFDVRKGVTFHSGKTLDADDIIYSLNLHRGDTKSAAKDLLSAIVGRQEARPEPGRHHALHRQRRPALQSVGLSRARGAERLHRLGEARRHRRLRAGELRARREAS